VSGGLPVRGAASAHGLLKFIGDFANWDVAANQTYLDVAHGLVSAAHDAEPPLVVDPFAGVAARFRSKRYGLVVKLLPAT
jgi:hypothetical protein